MGGASPLEYVLLFTGELIEGPASHRPVQYSRPARRMLIKNTDSGLDRSVIFIFSQSIPISSFVSRRQVNIQPPKEANRALPAGSVSQDMHVGHNPISKINSAIVIIGRFITQGRRLPCSTSCDGSLR